MITVMKSLNNLMHSIVDKLMFNDKTLTYKYKIDIIVDGIVKESRIIDSMPSDTKMKEIMAGAMREWNNSKLILCVHEIKIDIDRNAKHIRHGY